MDSMNIYTSVTQLIGHTPLMEIKNYEAKYDLRATILAKLEYFNPAGSIKDRAALCMIENAERKGLIKAGSVIIEPTSGNTGIGLAMVAASRSYRVILTMPDTMSTERRRLLTAYGAEIELTSGKDGMRGAIEKAEELAAKIPNSFIPSQFTNPDNAMAHINTTGPEIWADTDGKIDILVAGIGTGGTITGCGEFLKAENPEIKVVGFEPFTSPLLTEGKAGSHNLQGIGANFIPEIFNRDICDEIMTVKDEDAFKTVKDIARFEGILIGITSGAAIHLAAELAKKPENLGKKIVAILPDGGDRYMSTGIYD